MWRAALCACAAALVLAAPAVERPHDDDDDVDQVYDQRQNGSENLRVSVSNVTVVMAPANELGAAFADLLMGNSALLGLPLLLKDSAAAQRSRHKLSNLLHPLVSRLEPSRTSHH